MHRSVDFRKRVAARQGALQLLHRLRTVRPVSDHHDPDNSPGVLLGQPEDHHLHSSLPDGDGHHQLRLRQPAVSQGRCLDHGAADEDGLHREGAAQVPAISGHN